MAATSATAHAQESTGPGAKGLQSPPTASSTPQAVPTSKEPPFLAAGVVVTTAQRSAALILLDDNRREIGILTLREGESFAGYRLTAVEPSRVLLEQDGTIYAIPVGRPFAGPRGAPETGGKAARKPYFVPGSEKPTPDIPYVGRDARRGPSPAPPSGPAPENPPDREAVQNLLEHLFNDPQMQQRLEQRRPKVQQEVERAREDRQAPTEPPRAPATPPPATSR